MSLVSPGNIDTAMTRHVAARMPGPELVATTIADLVQAPRREVVVPRRHYAIAWLEQALPAWRISLIDGATGRRSERRSGDMDILITGGNGLLGRHLVPALQDRGDSVRVLALPGRGHVLARPARGRGPPGRYPRGRRRWSRR